jgi:hypothetical protein
MTTCLWRSWEARSDLEANGIVSRDVRTRVVAFLTAVFAAIDGLAATLPGATDDDLIAVLGPSVLGAARARAGSKSRLALRLSFNAGLYV